MNLKTFIEQGRLDFSKLYFGPDTGTAYSHSFGIAPEEFITFAKADFFKADKRGLVNALSNAKRAIDCQVDSFLLSLGLRPENLDKQLGAKGVSSLSFGIQANGGPLKFRFLQALGIATPGIVSRMRRLRNLLEHEYKTPRKRDVGDAIDVAELFVQACKGKMNSVMHGIAFGSGLTKARGREQVAREFYISFDNRLQPQFDVRFWDHDHIARYGTGKSPCLTVTVGDEGFVPLMKLLWQADWDKDMTDPLKCFLTELGLTLPRTKFRVRDRQAV
jgi:hypothetical protein